MKKKYLLIAISITIPLLIYFISVAENLNNTIPIKIEIDAVVDKNNNVKMKSGTIIGKLKKETEVYDLSGNKVGRVTLFNNEEPETTGD